MVSPRRLPILTAFPAFYVVIATLRTGNGHPNAIVLFPLALIIGWMGGRVPEGTSKEGARRRIWCAVGMSIALATTAMSTRPGWAAIAREVALAIAALAAIDGIVAIDGDIGLAPRASEASAPKGFGSVGIRRFAQGGILFAAVVAISEDAHGWIRHTGGSEAVASATAAASIFFVGTCALVIALVRRLELSVAPRAFVAAGAAGLGLVGAVILATARDIDSDAALAVAGSIACAVIVRIARSQAPLALAQWGRRVLTLAIFGSPVAGLGYLAASGRISNTGSILVLFAIALAVGALGQKLEEPFLPMKGRLLEALAEARDAARAREVREAMAHAMLKIRDACAVGLGANAAPSPELWLLHPTRVITVNSAGYLSERNAQLPEGIFDVALGELHATLRTSVLRALEVRRADLRPYLAWLDQRGALFATVIAESDDPDGLIVFPAGMRTDELTLEEARAAKLLADSFVAVSQMMSAKVRHLQREKDLRDELDRSGDEIERLKHVIALDVGRNALAATRLARPATVGIYSAASRMAYDALERRIAQEAPIILVARAGIDPVPFVSRAHLSGPRKDAPFVVVDCTASREHDIGRWSDEKTSPLALADRGVLLLVDGAALPRDIQVIVARTVAERRAPWERRASPLDVVLAFSSTSNVETLVEENRLAPELAARFEAAEPIVLPGLRERAEDLRSIVADRLAREGLRVHGRPTGIDMAAFAILVEHDFEAEDAELTAIVTKLVARAKGDVVRAADVHAIGLTAPAEEEPVASFSTSGSSSRS